MKTGRRIISVLVAISMIAALFSFQTVVLADELPEEAVRTWVPVNGTWAQAGTDFVGGIGEGSTDYWKLAQTKDIVVGDFTFTAKFKFDFSGGAAVANRYFFVLRDQGGTYLKLNTKPEITAGGTGILFTRPDLGGRMFFFDGYENRTYKYFSSYDPLVPIVDAEGYITFSISIQGNVVTSLKFNGNEVQGIKRNADLDTDPFRPLSDIALPAQIDGRISAGQFISNPAIQLKLLNETSYPANFGGYNVSAGGTKIISKINPGLLVSDFTANLFSGNAYVPYVNICLNNTFLFKDSIGAVLTSTSPIGTGATVDIVDDETTTIDSYTFLVYGDANGDSIIDVTDLAVLKNHILNYSALAGMFAKAADTSKNGSITISDLLAVKKHILIIETISQQ